VPLSGAELVVLVVAFSLGHSKNLCDDDDDDDELGPHLTQCSLVALAEAYLHTK